MTWTEAGLEAEGQRRVSVLRAGQAAGPGPEGLPPHPTLPESHIPSKPRDARVQARPPDHRPVQGLGTHSPVKTAPGSSSLAGVRCDGSHRGAPLLPSGSGPRHLGVSRGLASSRAVAPQGGNVGVSCTNPFQVTAEGVVCSRFYPILQCDCASTGNACREFLDKEDGPHLAEH